MPSGHDTLSASQLQLLRGWLPDMRVERRHDWGLIPTTVLEVTDGDDRYIVKAGGASDHHIARELHAHATWLEPWTRSGRAPRLAFGDLAAKLLVTVYLPGELILGSVHEGDPSAFRQAGALLYALHAQATELDDGYEELENAKALRLLDEPHRIDAQTEALLRASIASWPTPAQPLVPTHGDWHPRNWLIHEGVVHAIDFGRAAMRPARTDLVRLATNDFQRDPALEHAFLEGYGSDPRADVGWMRTLVRDGIATATWAYKVGDHAFEAQGRRMIADALP